MDKLWIGEVRVRKITSKTIERGRIKNPRNVILLVKIKEKSRPTKKKRGENDLTRIRKQSTRTKIIDNYNLTKVLIIAKLKWSLIKRRCDPGKGELTKIIIGITRKENKRNVNLTW
jgi:hypothetical protein